MLRCCFLSQRRLDRAGDIAGLARKRLSQEQELAIDLSSFVGLPARYPEIATV